MNYKKSKYNYYCFNKDDILIFNTLNGSFSKITKEKFKSYEFLKNNSFNESNKYLLNAGIIIPKDIDEEILYNKYKHSIIENHILSIVIIITSKCNFRCKYCFESDYRFQPNDLTEEYANKIIRFISKNINKYSGLSITWFGGEPLLKLDRIKRISKQIINLCNCAKKFYTASIITNGYLLNKNVFCELLECKIREYQITIDGLKSTHDKLRPLKNGIGTFKVITKNLKEIKDVQGSYRISLRTNCNINVLSNIEEYVNYFENMFGSDNRFKIYLNPIYNAGGSFNKEMGPTLLRLNEYDLALILLDLLKNKSHFDEDWIISRLNPRVLCGAYLMGNYVFSEKGQVCKCSTHYQNDDICVIGSINNRVEIDTCKEAIWLFNLDEYDTCKECKFKPICFSNQCPYHKLRNDINNKICFLKEDNNLKLSKLLIAMDEMGMFKSI